MTTSTVRLTAKQYLKLHPEKYVMVTYEFGAPIFIAPCSLMKVNVTDKKESAEQWSSMDNTPMKLGYHQTVTGYKGLIFEQI